jgi:hypothetical protein
MAENQPGKSEFTIRLRQIVESTTQDFCQFLVVFSDSQTDERSTRCVSAGRACEFADPSIPLRDRKATCLPGEQQPWIISQDAPPVTLMVNSPFGKSVEPFDCLGLDMTLRSRELLHYCKRKPCSIDLAASLTSLVHNSHDSADLVLSKASRNMYVPYHPSLSPGLP